MDNFENKVDGKLNIKKLPINATKYYRLDHKQDWMLDLLLELCENMENKELEHVLSRASINADLEIMKKFNPEYGDYLLVNIQLHANYVTQCVRTLEEMDESVDIDVRASFMSSHLEKTEIFQDQTEMFDSGHMHELYFYDKGIVDLVEMVHEQIYLNVNEYPVKDEDAPLPGSGTQQ